MTLEQLTQDIVDEETAKFDYKGDVRIKEQMGDPCFSGRIDLLTTAKIEICYNPDYEKEAESMEKIVPQPFRKAFTAVMQHELNHKGGGRFLGCPRTIDLHAEKVLEPVSEVLKREDFPNVPVSSGQTLYAYMANMVEDIIDNSELGNKTDHIGMFLCYHDDAIHCKEGLSPLFSAFVKLQEVLFGGRRSRKLLNGHHPKDDKVDQAVENVMQRTGMSRMQRQVVTRRKKKRKDVFDRRRAMEHYTDEENWPEISKIITEEFCELIDKDELENPQYIEETFLPLKGEGDSFGDEMEDADTKMKFVWKKYQGKGQESGEDDTEFQPPAYLESFEALDLLYQRLARNLHIKTESSTHSESMPVMWYGNRPATPRDRRVRVRLGRDGCLELTAKRYHEDEEIEYTESMPGLPEIKFVMLDTSSSMQCSIDGSQGKIMNPWASESVQWDDRSRYHHALIAWYGLLELLRRQGTLRHTSVKLANYSRETKKAVNLKEAKRLALSPQFGGTQLELPQIRDMFGTKQLVISLSDGDVMNWYDIKTEYIIRARNNHYFHLQIGGQSNMSMDLEKAGLHVVYDDGSNLGNIVVDLTKPFIVRKKKW